jgi:hypothetical protein
VRWLDARFSERLEKLKHEQQKEIESIRQRVQWHFSRVSKIHEKEFEILPRAWFLLHEAHGLAGDLVGRLRQIPDFQSMPDPMLQEFVAASAGAAFGGMKWQPPAKISGRGNNRRYWRC